MGSFTSQHHKHNIVTSIDRRLHRAGRDSRVNQEIPGHLSFSLMLLLLLSDHMIHSNHLTATQVWVMLMLLQAEKARLLVLYWEKRKQVPHYAENPNPGSLREKYVQSRWTFEQMWQQRRKARENKNSLKCTTKKKRRNDPESCF